MLCVLSVVCHVLACICLCVREKKAERSLRCITVSFGALRSLWKCLPQSQIPMLSAASPLPLHSHSLLQEGEFRGACGETKSSLWNLSSMPLIYMRQTLWGLGVSHSITDLTACSIATDCHMQYETRDFIQTLAYTPVLYTLIIITQL